MSKSIAIENSALKFTNSEDSDLNLFGLTLDNTYLKLPTGNTAQRPASPQTGMIRFNSQTNSLEGYNGTLWANLPS